MDTTCPNCRIVLVPHLKPFRFLGAHPEFCVGGSNLHWGIDLLIFPSYLLLPDYSHVLHENEIILVKKRGVGVTAFGGRVCCIVL